MSVAVGACDTLMSGCTKVAFSLMSLLLSKGWKSAADMFTINKIKVELKVKCSNFKGEIIKQIKILIFHFSLILSLFILSSIWEFISHLGPQTWFFSSFFIRFYVNDDAGKSNFQSKYLFGDFELINMYVKTTEKLLEDLIAWDGLNHNTNKNYTERIVKLSMKVERCFGISHGNLLFMKPSFFSQLIKNVEQKYNSLLKWWATLFGILQFQGYS